VLIQQSVLHTAKAIVVFKWTRQTANRGLANICERKNRPTDLKFLTRPFFPAHFITQVNKKTFFFNKLLNVSVCWWFHWVEVHRFC
jgi:hypothetical protein